MKRQTSLSDHVIQFARFLRAHKFPIGPDEEGDVLMGMTAIDWSDPQQFKEVQRAAFCKHVEQYQAFDQHYEQYWSELARSVDSKTKQVAEEQQKPKKNVAPSIQVLKNWLHGNRENDVQDIYQASDEHVLANPDLSMLSEHHHRDWAEVIQLIRKYVEKQKTRRWVRSGDPIQLDFRKVLKKSIAKGGEITEVSFRKPKKSKAHLLLLCDVSRSMELYSRFLIQMMYALQNSSLQIRCFAFSTGLYPVSHLLKRRSLTEALKLLSDEVESWSGGTKIGACFNDFLKRFGRKSIRRNTFTFILSDGWDAGDIDELTNSMESLQKRSKKLIWINPLARSEAFNPEVLGMKAAMPFVDLFVPAVDAASLKRSLKNMR